MDEAEALVLDLPAASVVAIPGDERRNRPLCATEAMRFAPRSASMQLIVEKHRTRLAP